MQTTSVLTPQQVVFFETFGFLKIPGLFRDEIGEITEAFEEVFAEEGHIRMEVDVPLHRHDPRIIIPAFVDKHPTLARLPTDPRLLSIVRSVFGEDYEYAESDGNLAYCHSEWHADTFAAPMTVRHIKLSFYLDRLREDSGSIRLIPGTHHWQDPFAKGLRQKLNTSGQVPEVFGIETTEVPSTRLDSDPGDVLLWDYRTIHASFNGVDRRRFFSVNYCEAPAQEPAAGERR